MSSIVRTTPVEHLVTGPTLEPLDLNETVKMLQSVAELDETIVDVLISSARQRFEERTGRQLLTATWEEWRDCFSADGAIELAHAPLQTVVSIKYVDTDGNLQTLSTSTYQVKAPSGPQCDRGWIELAYGMTWPAIRYESGAVRIQYTAGYGDAPGSVPELVRSALYLLVTDFFCSRCAADGKPAPKKPIGMEDLLSAYVLRSKREAW
jgi:uncharacterized phiE125 gp8 family phage protein